MITLFVLAPDMMKLQFWIRSLNQSKFITYSKTNLIITTESIKYVCKLNNNLPISVAGYIAHGVIVLDGFDNEELYEMCMNRAYLGQRSLK